VKVHLYYVGKPRDPRANAMAQDYVERTRRFVRLEMREIQPGRFDPWERHPAASKILLDPAGRALDSARLATLFEKAEMESRDLVFVIGGAAGLPPAWKTRADLLLSLSPMTFSHELARVLLAEQIYRAFATLRGHPYPR
jgi:23S rRNA (pseudouridine1915-N3)-methyltransferase